MSTVIHHNFGGTSALLLVGTQQRVSPPKKRRAVARRATPSVTERIECLKKGAADCRKLAADVGNKRWRETLIARAEKWERRAARLADKMRGRQQPGELFAGGAPS